MPSLFPSVGTQVASSLIHFLGVSLLSHCFSRRLALERLTSLTGIFRIPWPRLCLLLVFLDSWLFLFTSGILIFGIGLEVNEDICSAAIYLCIVFYATSKLLIYAFLIERVYIVWCPVARVGRFNSRVYVISLVTVCIYAVVIALLFFGRETFFRDPDMACSIGLKTLSSVPLLIYDVYITIFLTSLFLWPLLHAETLNSRLKCVAQRALFASAVALITSTVNMSVLTALHGHELGWICLGSCGVDVVINAYALYWATGSKKRKNKSPTFPSDVVSRDLNALPHYHAGASVAHEMHHQSQLAVSDPSTPESAHPQLDYTQTSASGPDVEAEPSSMYDRLYRWLRKATHEPPPSTIHQVTVTTDTSKGDGFV